jgi:hypothetical protein
LPPVLITAYMVFPRQAWEKDKGDGPPKAAAGRGRGL